MTPIQIVRDLEGLNQLAGGWDSLAATLASPMQQYIWTRACAEVFGADGGLQMVAVGLAGGIVAVAPLIKQGSVVSRLKMLGVSELYEPMDFLYAEPSQLPLLAEALAKTGAALNLGRIPADSPVIGALRKAYRRGWVYTLPAAPCPYITLNADWIEPERQFNSGRRSDFRRARRHADRMGEVSLEVLSPAPAELDSLLEEAYAVEKAGWKGAKGTALAVDAARGNFYRRYAAAAGESGILRLCFMRIGRRAVAMQFAVECNNRFWLLKIGYDEEFARCSPGALLMLHTLQYAATRGLASYEFLGLPEPWTRNWTESLRPCVSLRAYMLGWHGIAAQCDDLARLAWKGLRKNFRR
jgi:CelD/BcsL family acetyltransferase involved in cellulose biosynthesis